MQFVPKKSGFRVLSVLLMVLFAMPVLISASAEATATPSKTPSHYFTATYFHGSFRCGTCQRIETLSKQAVTNHFDDALKNGTLVWRAVNVDEPDNRHYTKEYGLYTRSLIISEVKDGKEIRWKNLEKVWDFVRNDDAFDRYVSSEIKEWMAPE